MKRVARWVPLLALSFAWPLASGCGSSDDPSSAPPGADLEARLASDTGVTWLVDRDDQGAPIILTSLSAPPPIASATPRDQAAITFLQRYADVFGAGELASELVLVEDRDDDAAPGAHHLRFAQRIPGSDVRVFGADTFVHFDPNGAIAFLSVGLTKEIAKLAAQPVTSADEARIAAEATVRARDPQAAISSPKPPALVVHRAENADGTLAWRVTLQARVNGELEAPEVFVDAKSAAILEVNDTAVHANKSVKASNFHFYHSECGQKVPSNESTITYDDAFVPALVPLKTNRLQQKGDAVSSTLITDGYVAGDLSTEMFFTAPIVAVDPTSFDFLDGHQGSGAAVSTHENLARTDAYFRTLGQNGWDTTSELAIRAAVHAWTLDPKHPKSPTRPLARVIDFTGYLNDVLYFGDGTMNADVFTAPNCSAFPAGVALDVVAHEFTHGVVAHTALLGTSGEAGALNEAIADVLGASAEHSLRAGNNNFIIGEDAFFATGGLRDLRAPRNMDATFEGEQVPRAYSERLATTALDKDNGHVHDNGVIGGHAFFLMTMGGTNAVTHVTVGADQALGWASTPRLWYTALLGMDRNLGKTYRRFARIQTNSTRDEARRATAATVATACAWRAVAVFNDTDLAVYGVTCDASPAPPPPPPPSGGSEPNPCAGHGDRPVCSVALPTTAVVCRAGLPVGIAVCADPELRCKQASATDGTATMTSDGALECE